jgi:hypothetical protein
MLSPWRRRLRLRLRLRRRLRLGLVSTSWTPSTAPLIPTTSASSSSMLRVRGL